jgi:hypothetical protein
MRKYSLWLISCTKDLNGNEHEARKYITIRALIINMVIINGLKLYTIMRYGPNSAESDIQHRVHGVHSILGIAPEQRGNKHDKQMKRESDLTISTRRF